MVVWCRLMAVISLVIDWSATGPTANASTLPFVALPPSPSAPSPTPLGGRFLALDEAEKIGLSPLKVRVHELAQLSLGFAFEHTLLELGNFVKPIHVQLANE